MDPCLGILGPKMGPMFRDFLSKTRPIWAAHPRIAFLWEYPPPGGTRSSAVELWTHYPKVMSYSPVWVRQGFWIYLYFRIRHSFAHLRPVILSANWSISRLQSWTCSSLPTVAEFVKLKIVKEIQQQFADLYKVQLCNRQFFCGVHSDLRGKGIWVSPAWVRVLCPWVRHYTLTCSSCFKCKWIPAQAGKVTGSLCRGLVTISTTLQIESSGLIPREKEMGTSGCTGMCPHPIYICIQRWISCLSIGP